MSPVPFSPITTLHRYPASPSQFDGAPPPPQSTSKPLHYNAPTVVATSPLPPMSTGGQQLQTDASQTHPPSSVSAATAEIVAQQSQDYVDEQLAEFQNQIFILQGKGKNNPLETSSPEALFTCSVFKITCLVLTI